MQRSGIADLPLHRGTVPKWLSERMTKLGTAIAENLLFHYGASQLLSRLADPFWFQALGCVLGMDWHSSGVTTSVLGALKRGLNPRAGELGVYICGGRGRHSRKTPDELRAYADHLSLNGDSLVRSSRLAARIDNNAVGDGFQLYLHAFIVTTHGEWAIVQQGMNPNTATARRYHWHSVTIRDFTCEPHTGIAGEHQGVIVNLVDKQAKPSQSAMLEVVRQSPDTTLQQVQRLMMPHRHDVHPSDVDLRRLGSILAVAYEREFRDFASLLLLEKLGPRTLQSLALVAEVVHGTPIRFSDPARFSFAHGGKDGQPFPVPLQTYDETVTILRRALESAKLGHTERVDGIRRLDHFVRGVEQSTAPTTNFRQIVYRERTISKSLSGKSVFDAAMPLVPKRKLKQLSLF